MWRAWLADGQTFEVNWGHCGIGVEVTIHSHDPMAHRFLWFGLGFVQVFLPLGLIENKWPVGDEPGWGICGTFGEVGDFVLRWGERSGRWRWPFHVQFVRSEYFVRPGEWREPRPYSEPERRPKAWSQTLPYTYTLKSGEVQHRKATIRWERWYYRRHLLHLLGWPMQCRNVIDVEFDGEVGERSGSWKGGTIGCGYDMLPGEEPEQTLRRMERERKF